MSKPLITEEEAATNVTRFLEWHGDPNVKARRAAVNWDGHYKVDMKCQQDNGYWLVITSIVDTDEFPLKSTSGGSGTSKAWTATGRFRSDGVPSHHDLIGPYVLGATFTP